MGRRFVRVALLIGIGLFCSIEVRRGFREVFVVVSVVRRD